MIDHVSGDNDAYVQMAKPRLTDADIWTRLNDAAEDADEFAKRARSLNTANHFRARARRYREAVRELMRRECERLDAERNGPFA